EKRVFLVILFTSFSGSLVSRISGAVQLCHRGEKQAANHYFIPKTASPVTQARVQNYQLTPTFQET
ncbi:hypothetical protein R9K62_00795, partial [Escherichia coli]